MPSNSFGESSCTAAASGLVQVRGARENNLKEVDVSIPRNALVVFSGVSGSGKSSLAFGTIYAEAQRRYFESVAPYARRLIDQAGVTRDAAQRVSLYHQAQTLYDQQVGPILMISQMTDTAVSAADVKGFSGDDAEATRYLGVYKQR